MSHKIFIVEDHPVVRQGLGTLIEREADLVICGEAEETDEALRKIPEADPSLVMIDISLKGASGIELIKQLKAQYPNLPMLVISGHDEMLYAERTLRAGARGYIMKHEAVQVVIGAIRKVLSGQLYVSERLRDRFLSLHVGSGVAEAGTSPLERLSDRELEVFEWIGRGLSTQQIAEALHLSPKTVETYRANIKAKLGIDGANELIQRAVLWIEGIGER